MEGEETPLGQVEGLGFRVRGQGCKRHKTVSKRVNDVYHHHKTVSKRFYDGGTNQLRKIPKQEAEKGPTITANSLLRGTSSLLVITLKPRVE